MSVSNKQMELLKLYQSGSKGDSNASNHVINAFLDFLSDPNENNMKRLKGFASRYDTMELINNVRSLIDLSCEYALCSEHVKLGFMTKYRCENKKNVPAYMNGFLTSFKSSSSDMAEAGVFDHDDSDYLIFENEGLFLPHINVNGLVKNPDQPQFSDEKEVIFPPFIKCTVEDGVRNINGKQCLTIHLDDDFSSADPKELEEAIASYEAIREKFQSDFVKCMSNRKISDEFMQECKVVYEYLRQYARSKYYTYNLDYSFTYGFSSFSKKRAIYNDYGGLYYALSDAVYNGSGTNNNYVPQVFALKHLLSDEEIENLHRAYLDSDRDMERFDNYLKEKFAVDGKPLTNEELAQLLQYFNIAAGCRMDGTPAYARERKQAADDLYYKNYAASRSKS